MQSRRRNAFVSRLGTLAALLAAPVWANPSPGSPTDGPGDIVQMAKIPAPPGATGWKVLYRSTGLKGEPIVVSGLVFAPSAPPPQEGRRVIAWAHPTTGVAEPCAPSLFPKVLERIPSLADLLGRGFVVAATDYPGLGTPGPHPYLIGVSEGRAVLDSVRAAKNVPGSGAGSRYAVWGHSQGGHAALFTGQLSRDYAPELTLVGVAAIAPATDLEQLLKDDIDERVGRVLASMALVSWGQVYDTSVDAILNPPARPIVKRVAKDCVENVLEGYKVALDSWTLTPRFLSKEVYSEPPWSRIIAENKPGQAPAGAPVYVFQGMADKCVRPQVTAAFVEGLCARGERVEYDTLIDGDHLTAGIRSAEAAAAWMSDRFEGKPPPSTCPN